MLQDGREIQAEYERTDLDVIERGEGDPAGHVAGLLATDGEASDGDILDIDGGQIPKRAPLLFGHQDWSGDRNLGSWERFEKTQAGKDGKLGGKGIRGFGQIELGGAGEPQAWRDDIAHMIERKHIGALSVRWSPVGDPIRRVNLPSDHVAFVDSQTATGNKRWGLFFPKWRLLEGSVVTLGADPAALIGRMRDSEGDVRRNWRAAINSALTEQQGTKDLVAVQLPNDELAYTERAIYDALLELANERMNIALDLYEELHDQTIQLALGAEPRAKIEEETITPGKVDDVPEKKEPAGDSRSALELDVRELELPTAVDALTQGLLEALAQSDERWDKGVRELVSAFTGKQ